MSCSSSVVQPNVGITGVPPGGSSSPKRLATFDLARAVAAASIIWLHTPESDDLRWTGDFGRFAVPFFTMAAILFVFTKFEQTRDLGIGAFTLGRLQRLYVPFIAWSGIYLLLRNLKHLFLSSQPYVAPAGWMLWVGSAHHLWFVPFILVVSIFAYGMADLVARRDRLRTPLAIVAVVVGLAVGSLPAPECLNRPTETNLLLWPSWRAASAVFWGLSFALLRSRRLSGAPRHPRSALALGPILALAGCAYTALVGRPVPLAESIAGAGWLLFALTPVESPTVKRWSFLGQLSYPVYLVHIAFVEGIQAVARGLGIRVSPVADVSTFVLALVGSVVAARTLTNTPRLRWLTG
jgi:peptidoglycan/LPS O-acetylase OafA/YrhL